MSDIASEIASRRKRAAELRRQADVLDGEARGLELASKIAASIGTATISIDGRPVDVKAAADQPASEKVAVSPPPADAQGGKGGRQKGAISKGWRAILMDLRNRFPMGFREAEVSEAALRLSQLSLREKDARDRLKFYAELGYVALTPNGATYVVTDLAVEKFAAWAA